MAWGSPVEVERRRRIRVAVWAWAYELKSTSLVDDATYDREALLIDPTIDTGNAEMDAFFREKFSPHTGQWVHRHPDKPGLAKLFEKMKPQDSAPKPAKVRKAKEKT
jgi:hypothetical protein